MMNCDVHPWSGSTTATCSTTYWLGTSELSVEKWLRCLPIYRYIPHIAPCVSILWYTRTSGVPHRTLCNRYTRTLSVQHPTRISIYRYTRTLKSSTSHFVYRYFDTAARLELHIAPRVIDTLVHLVFNIPLAYRYIDPLARLEFNNAPRVIDTFVHLEFNIASHSSMYQYTRTPRVQYRTPCNRYS
jgi:hypothetical protein